MFFLQIILGVLFSNYCVLLIDGEETVNCNQKIRKLGFIVKSTMYNVQHDLSLMSNGIMVDNYIIKCILN